MQISLRFCTLVVLAVACLLAAFVAGTHFPAGSPRTRGAPAITGTKHRVGSRLFKEMTVTPGPGCVTVQGQVELLDPGVKTYGWGLVIKEKGMDKVVLDMGYPERVFTVPGGEDRLADFRDTQPLPPGDYQFELMIYEVVDGRSERGPGIIRDVSVK